MNYSLKDVTNNFLGRSNRINKSEIIAGRGCWYLVKINIDRGSSKYMYQRKHVRHFADDKHVRNFAENILKSNIWNDNCRIRVHISPKFTPKVPLTNKPLQVWLVSWRRICDKSLSELNDPLVYRSICISPGLTVLTHSMGGKALCSCNHVELLCSLMDSLSITCFVVLSHKISKYGFCNTLIDNYGTSALYGFVHNFAQCLEM